MKFSVQQDALHKAVAKLGTRITRSNAQPILSHFLISASEGKLEITASDMEISARVSVEVEVTEPGSVAVPAAKLSSLVNALIPGEPVSCQLEGDRFILRSGRGRFALSTMPAEDFTDMQPEEGGSSITLGAQDLVGLFSRTSFAMPTNDERVVLNGTLFEVENGQLNIVATDGHRLAFGRTLLDSAEGGACSVIIPKKTVVELQRMLKSTNGSVTVSCNVHSVGIEGADLRVVSKLVDGTFPDYKAFMPVAQESPIVVDSGALQSGLARIAVVSDEKGHAMSLEVADNEMRLSARNGPAEGGSDNIEIEGNPDPCKGSFNLNYLSDALGAISAESVELHLSNGFLPSFITAGDDPYTSVQVVMPLKD